MNKFINCEMNMLMKRGSIHMKKSMLAMVVMLLLVIMASCSPANNDGLLNPDKPITVTLWHYYNGQTKESFDRLISQFNETIGTEAGIVVDAQSQGDVNQLATAVFDAANQTIGSAPMPNIFASYPDNAFRVNQIVKLVKLDQYFTKEELSEYRKEFLEEGRFGQDGGYYIVPIAKSSENLYVNKNYWEPFAARHGYTEADLSTWEGIQGVAKAYYEETGRGFFSVDANANYMLAASMQLGSELYLYGKDGTVTFDLKPETAKMIWQYFYTPYINGYYVKTGRFSSDDAKTGTVLSYTGSTAGAAYFPVTVAFSEKEEVSIEPLVLPYPYFANGAKVAIQQGAGMCIAGSDKTHEYAAAQFLKWFTNTAQNLEFAVSTGYFPVKNNALEGEKLLVQAAQGKTPSAAVMASIKASDIMFSQYTLYNNKPFKGSFDMRVLLDTQLINKITADLASLGEQVNQGGDRAALIADLTSDESFDNWYAQMKKEAELILNRN